MLLSGKESMVKELTGSKDEPTTIIMLNWYSISKFMFLYTHRLMQLSDFIEEVS